MKLTELMVLLVGMKTKKNKLNCIEFDRIKGGKPFDTNQDWYIKMMKEIKQIEK